MRSIATSMMVMACLGLAACGGGIDGGESGASESTTMAQTTGVSETVTSTESGTGTETATETGGEQAIKGLPGGVSSWTGQGHLDDWITSGELQRISRLDPLEM